VVLFHGRMPRLQHVVAGGFVDGCMTQSDDRDNPTTAYQSMLFYFVRVRRISALQAGESAGIGERPPLDIRN
jgi:hypothetical protein